MEAALAVPEKPLGYIGREKCYHNVEQRWREQGRREPDCGDDLISATGAAPRAWLEWMNNGDVSAAHGLTQSIEAN